MLSENMVVAVNTELNPQVILLESRQQYKL